mgnify:CR=1 FL=1
MVHPLPRLQEELGPEEAGHLQVDEEARFVGVVEEVLGEGLDLPRRFGPEVEGQGGEGEVVEVRIGQAPGLLKDLLEEGHRVLPPPPAAVGQGQEGEAPAVRVGQGLPEEGLGEAVL